MYILNIRIKSEAAVLNFPLNIQNSNLFNMSYNKKNHSTRKAVIVRQWCGLIENQSLE